jgi:SHS2 domain-containing protein
LKNYELLEHTADIKIRVTAGDLKDLFINSAAAIFDIIAERNNPKATPQTKITLKQTADTLEELFINWLNELISLSAVKELIFTDFKIKKLDEHSLQAEAIGESIKNYKINSEIKAATYHELKLTKIDSGWQAEVILDV